MHPVYSMTNSATAVWRGNLLEGEGRISTPSGALENVFYDYEGRFGGKPGCASPEEFLGAALASCYAMALADNISKSTGQKPQSIRTDVAVTLGHEGARPSITAIEISVSVQVEKVTPHVLRKIAKDTAASCPIAKSLRVTPLVNAATLDTEMPAR